MFCFKTLKLLFIYLVINSSLLYERGTFASEFFIFFIHFFFLTLLNFGNLIGQCCHVPLLTTTSMRFEFKYVVTMHTSIRIILLIGVECSAMIRETGVQSQVASYQKKWYLIPPCLTLSNIRYVSRVKWSNPQKGVAPSPTPRCSSY